MTTSPAANKIDPTDPVNAQILEEWKQRQKEVEEREKKEEHDLETQPPLPGSEKPLYSFTNADHPVKEHHEDSENWNWSEKGLHQVVTAPLDKLPELPPEDTTPETDPDNQAARRDRAEREERAKQAEKEAAKS